MATKNTVEFPNSLESRVLLLEHIAGDINKSLDRIEKRFDKIDARFDKIDEKFDKMDERMRSDFRWLVTIFGSLMLGLMGIMAHGFHWF